MSELGSERRSLRHVKSASSLRSHQSRNSNNKQRRSLSRFGSQIEFSKEPYTYGNNFAIYAPTFDSIKQLYKSQGKNEFQKQSNIQQRQEIQSQRPQSVKQEIKKASILSEKGSSIENKTYVPKVEKVENDKLNPENLKKLDSKQEPKKNIMLNKLKSYRTNSTIAIAQESPVKQLQVQKSNYDREEHFHDTQMRQTMGRTISYPGLPWVQVDTQKPYKDPFGKHSMRKTQAALRASGKETIEDIIQKSQTINSNLSQLLKQQQDMNYLSKKGMTPLPQQPRGPLIQTHSTGKKLLIAENNSHNRETNPAYSRKANGTFYNH